MKGRQVNLETRLRRTDVPGSVISTIRLADSAGIETALVIDRTLRVIAHGPWPQAECASPRIACGRFTTGSAYWDAHLRQLVATGSPAEMHPGTQADGAPAISILPITSIEDADCQRQAIVVIRAPRACPDNIAAISEACGLTATETDVLRHIYKGLSTVEVARSMGIANSTARTHLRHIFDKTSTSRQSELVYFVANYS